MYAWIYALKIPVNIEASKRFNLYAIKFLSFEDHWIWMIVMDSDELSWISMEHHGLWLNIKDLHGHTTNYLLPTNYYCYHYNIDLNPLRFQTLKLLSRWALKP